ncbi:MAG: O-antigen ligase family protein [Myxococcaceae bacterium]|nr:O-antigen ligase family protein [Myxococcaceae bacterium]
MTTLSTAVPGPKVLSRRAPFSGVAPKAKKGSRWTLSGVVVALIGFSVAGSAFRTLRIEVGGLSVHPCVLLSGLLLFSIGLKRLRMFPAPLAIAMGLFLLAFTMAGLLDEQWYLSLPLKLASFMVVVMATSLAVTSRQDLTMGVVGFALGVLVIAIFGTLIGDVGIETFNPLAQGEGNKNTYSLFALPAIAWITMLVLDGRRRATAFTVLLWLAAAVITLPIFLSANRSGWLGVATLGMLLLVGQRQRFKTAFVVAGIAVLLYVGVNELDTGVFTRRLAQTLDAYSSDNLRIALFVECFNIGLEYPLTGMGMVTICYELARRLSPFLAVENDFVGPHNALTFLFGAGGLMLAVPALYLAVTVWRQGKRIVGRTSMTPLRLLFLLWVVRAAFTDEALYAPAFAMAFGFAIAELRLATHEERETT